MYNSPQAHPVLVLSKFYFRRKHIPVFFTVLCSPQAEQSCNGSVLAASIAGSVHGPLFGASAFSIYHSSVFAANREVLVTFLCSPQAQA